VRSAQAISAFFSANPEQIAAKMVKTAQLSSTRLSRVALALHVCNLSK
jgi:hypothetical protein